MEMSNRSDFTLSASPLLPRQQSSVPKRDLLELGLLPQNKAKEVSEHPAFPGIGVLWKNPLRSHPVRNSEVSCMTEEGGAAGRTAARSLPASKGPRS